MALRCLLRRIPVRSPSSSSLMGPVRGPSPPRFLSTLTEDELVPKEIREFQEKMARIWDNHDKARKKRHDETQKEIARLREIHRRDSEKWKRYLTYLTVGIYATAAALFASSARRRRARQQCYSNGS